MEKTFISMQEVLEGIQNGTITPPPLREDAPSVSKSIMESIIIEDAMRKETLRQMLREAEKATDEVLQSPFTPFSFNLEERIKEILHQNPRKTVITLGDLLHEA